MNRQFSHPLSIRSHCGKRTARMVWLATLFVGLGWQCARAQQQDIVLADFEGQTYGDWKTSGTAFGSRPAHGALPGQMPVDGFQGNGLANSFQGGDDATGTLTSPPFKIERKYLQFLIGGGGWDGKTCLNLQVDGKVVRTATGPNTEPGGSERLQPGQWDVGEFLGQTATLEIVDNATGGWGHINVDQITESDRRNNAMIMPREVTRIIVITKPYLNFPVKNGAPKRHINVTANPKTDRDAEQYFDIELAEGFSGGRPDWWAIMDATPFLGRTITLTVDKLPENSTGLSMVVQTDEIKDGRGLYHETRRPQFHFTSRHGWLNDPNGLIFYDGEFHLFYQHNPYGWNWGNMHWGHAVSKDLVHWQELPEALYPDAGGTMYSGSAVVDWNHTAGFQSGGTPALVAMFTDAGHPFTQGLACSNDRGRTWIKYANNPVLNHLAAENRDPKVVWFAPEKKWVMALYLDHSDYALFSSPDLKRWQKLSDVNLPGDAECPNFFQVPLDGDTNTMRWVFFGASGVYVVGTFDGTKFKRETAPRHLHNGNCWYAAQVYSDIPASDGRCLLIPWGRLPDGDIFRGMTFNQMMGLPVELRLHSTKSGPVLTVAPVKELASLRAATREIPPGPLFPEENPLRGVRGDLFEIEAEIAPGHASEISFDLRGVPVTCDMAAQKISCLGCSAPLVLKAGNISLHMFVDRASVDIYGGDGTLYLPMAKALPVANQELKLSCVGDGASIVSLKVYKLKSSWE